MKTLALFNNEKNRLEATDSINDLYGIKPKDILLFGNALTINRYLMENELELSNIPFLKSELSKLRRDIKLSKQIDETLSEDDIVKLRNYVDDELLS